MKYIELADDLISMVGELLEILESVEWHQQHYNGSPACPCCGNQQHWKHAPDCDLASAIGVTEFEDQT